MDIIDNVLPEKEFGGLQSYMMGNDCPWFYQEDGTLSHLFYSAKGQLPREDEEICAATAVILDPIMVEKVSLNHIKLKDILKVVSLIMIRM